VRTKKRKKKTVEEKEVVKKKRERERESVCVIYFDSNKRGREGTLLEISKGPKTHIKSPKKMEKTKGI